MSRDISKEYLQVARIYKELTWLSYDPDYKDIDLKSAISIVKELKDRLSKQLDEGKR